MTKKSDALHHTFFCEWLIDFNAPRAYMVAYKKKKHTSAVDVNASQLLTILLKDTKYTGMLQKTTDKVEEETWLTKAYILDGLKEMTEKCMVKKPVLEFDYIDKELKQKQTEIIDDEGNEKTVGVYEFDSRGAKGGYELLGKHLKMFTDKLDINARIKENAVVVIGNGIVDDNKDDD